MFNNNQGTKKHILGEVWELFCVSDWQLVHKFEDDFLADFCEVAGRYYLDDTSFFRSRDEVKKPVSIERWSSAEWLDRAISPAIAGKFEDCARARNLISSINWLPLSAINSSKPVTVFEKADKAPTIYFDWTGSDADILCLAHEVAHAVQLALSNHVFMAPIAREFCAFLGEKILIDWLADHNAEMHQRILDIWHTETQFYLENDLDLIVASLKSSEASSYDYRMNYPIARLAFIDFMKRHEDCELSEFFIADEKSLERLELDCLTSQAGAINNYLPSMPTPVKSSIDAYRALGAATLLDIEFWKGVSEQSINAYYQDKLLHLQASSIFIALDDGNKPIGYASWHQPENSNQINLDRQCAPFGQHLKLQTELEKRFEQTGPILSDHNRSARTEQVAW